MENKIEAIKDWLETGSINFFGLPFAGKDTQCRLLAGYLGARMLSGGQILRSSVIPPRAREIMDAGELTPIEDYLKIVLPFLSKIEFRDKPLVLSSFGRWAGEEKNVIEAAKTAGHPIKAVVYLNASENKIRARHLKSQERGTRKRADDDAHKLDTRIKEFKEKTLPVIEYYRSKNLLVEVDANKKIKDETNDIIEALYALTKAS